MLFILQPWCAHDLEDSDMKNNFDYLRLSAMGLALAATTTSGMVSFIAGTERGGQGAERVTWIAIALVLLLATHLLPALIRNLSNVARSLAMVLWMACFLATTYGHATFFLNAQASAGAARARAVHESAPAAPAVSNGRPLESIAGDVATYTALLARAKSENCIRQCAAAKARRVALEARLVALEVEEEQARKRETAAEQREAELSNQRAREVALESDPVTKVIADTFGVSEARCNVILALLLGLLVEAIACVCWLVALSTTRENPIENPAGKESDAAVVPTQPSTAVVNRAAVPMRDLDLVGSRDGGSPTLIEETPYSTNSHAHTADVLLVASAIASHRLKPQVRDIRKFLACRTSHAVEVRRAWLALKESGVLSNVVQGTGPRLVHSAPIAA